MEAYLEVLVLVACAGRAEVLVFFAGVLPVVPGHAEFFEEDWFADFGGPLGGVCDEGFCECFGGFEVCLGGV